MVQDHLLAQLQWEHQVTDLGGEEDLVGGGCAREHADAVRADATQDLRHIEKQVG